jgi:NADPH:quinone reductase-like Zn-dependent oxidoreductase
LSTPTEKPLRLGCASALTPEWLRPKPTVRFERYGGIEELHVIEVPRPRATPGRAVVQVVAAAINSGEASIREGRLHERWPAHFPEGEGSDFAGVVTEVGEGVTSVVAGSDVIGWTDERASHAEAVSVPADQLIRKPAGVSWEVAGSLYVAGLTAWATVRAVDAEPGETVAISAAAGGVGSIAVQLARHAGAAVVGIAGPANTDWLVSRGVTPVLHGEGLAGRLKAAAPHGIDAFIDCFGGGYVARAVEHAVPKERIETISDWDAARQVGAHADGRATVENPAAVLTELAALVAAGELVVSIARTYPLTQVQDAYTELEKRHTRGKIVLLPGPRPSSHVG